MNEKKLPIKLILQRANDTTKNIAGGDVKFFCDFTADLQNSISDKFEKVLEYYRAVFDENENLPAVAKMVVRPEAIAKSHKPNELCRKCPIIGSEDLDENYIKVTKKCIQETLQLIKNPPSKLFKANITAVVDILPITVEDVISRTLVMSRNSEEFEKVKTRIKLKLFDFGDEYDDQQSRTYIEKKLQEFGYQDRYKVIKYGSSIELMKIEVDTYEELEKIASISGVKYIDFFQEYSLPGDECSETGIAMILDVPHFDSEIVIGIIDGGISDDNQYLAPYIYAREEYVSPEYQNHIHATFIASMIQYGNNLNGIAEKDNSVFKFLDIVAIPNSDCKFGLVDSIGEDELMEIVEEVMEKHSQKVKIWNISLGIETATCNGSMSDLGIFFDYIQDKYSVQLFISSGNLNQKPLRTWPPQEDMGERDRIIAPADSVRAITVGSIALNDSHNSLVKKNEPSPFSRRGPGANYIVKPDVVDYGGNVDKDFRVGGIGVKGLDPLGNIIEGVGTSYSTPRVVRKFSNVYDEMVDKDLLLAKVMIIHSARLTSRSILEQNQENIKYFGFGVPAVDSQDILHCSENEVTLVFRQKITQGTHLEMLDFPFPPSLIRNGKYYGEICMTLAYNPLLDQRFGKEYCRTNVDVMFGTYKEKEDGSIDFKGQVPPEKNWDEQYEKSRVENGFKWSPTKSYYRNMKMGIGLADGWKIRINMSPRNRLIVPPQEIVLIITFIDHKGNDIYSEIVNGLREKGYITNNLETRYQIRQRQ